jgi:hypothetical protein
LTVALIDAEDGGLAIGSTASLALHAFSAEQAFIAVEPITDRQLVMTQRKIGIRGISSTPTLPARATGR